MKLPWCCSRRHGEEEQREKKVPEMVRSEDRVKALPARLQCGHATDPRIVDDQVDRLTACGEVRR